MALRPAAAGLLIPHGAPPTTAGGWHLTFFDDFNGTSLNASNWRPRQNETHCSPCEPQLYLASRLKVAGGSLVITTDRDHVVGPGGALFNYSSGWVDSQLAFAQLYGKFEARMQLPPQNASGIWPAFWTLPLNGTCWPTGGEIDVFEYTANPLVNDVFGSYRWGTVCGDDNQLLPGAGYPGAGAPPIDWSADFHVFGVEWNSTAMTFLVDGHAYETKTAGDVILPVDPQYVVVNAAIAWYWMPDALAAYPARTLVDWVRVWEWREGGGGGPSGV